MVSAGEVFSRVRSDGRLTRDEFLSVDSRSTLGAAEALERWGKVRSTTGSVGGNRDFINVSGVGRFEWQSGDTDARRRAQRELVDALGKQFVFPILKSDSQRASSGGGLTEADRMRLRFGDESTTADVVDEIVSWGGSSVSTGSSSSSTGHQITKKLLGLAAAAALLGYGVIK
jgi:hypothetical protein